MIYTAVSQTMSRSSGRFCATVRFPTENKGGVRALLTCSAEILRKGQVEKRYMIDAGFVRVSKDPRLDLGKPL